MPVAVSIVCPFFNEESIIAEAARHMVACLQSQFNDWELILVNDGSADDSLSVLTKALRESENDRVRVLSYPLNQGRGRALKTGIDAAKGEIIVTTEADCSWGDDIAQRLVQKLEDNPDADFVVASPHLLGGGLVNVSLHRVFLTIIGNKLIRTFFDPSFTMSTGMTRAYRRHVIQPLLTSENGKEFHLEVLLKLTTIGFKGLEIPATITWKKPSKTHSREAAKRKSSTNLQRTIWTHLRFLAVAQPVRYFAYFSVLSFITGIFLLIAAVWMIVAKKTAVFLALLGILMLIFCLLLTGFAVIFVLLRETLREQWMSSYSRPLPPYVRGGHTVYPASAAKTD